MGFVTQFGSHCVFSIVCRVADNMANICVKNDFSKKTEKNILLNDICAWY
jgi:hypothetical protein